MSLKGFHILFISLSILMALGCGAWSFYNDVALPFGIGSVLVAVALLIYEISFIKKAGKIII